MYDNTAVVCSRTGLVRPCAWRPGVEDPADRPQDGQANGVLEVLEVLGVLDALEVCAAGIGRAGGVAYMVAVALEAIMSTPAPPAGGASASPNGGCAAC